MLVEPCREADVGSILGFGFAPFSGGTLSYIDMMGTSEKARRKARFALRAIKAAHRHGGVERKLLWPVRSGATR